MFADPISNSTLPVLERVVQFTQARHGVLAGNIANLNTPHYKSRDLSTEAFQDNLREAIDANRKMRSPGQGVVLGPLEPDHGELYRVSRSGAMEPFHPDQAGGLNEPLDDLLFHDGRDVNLEEQIVEINKNQGMHNLAIALMTAQFRQLQSAISERVA